MNFLAEIGIVAINKYQHINRMKKENIPKFIEILIKTEKPFLEEKDEDGYELIPITVPTDLFKQEIASIKTGSVIGIKGRIINKNKQLKVLTEKIQIF